MTRSAEPSVCPVDVTAFDLVTPGEIGFIAPDGTRLASAGRDGTLRVWDLDSLPPNDAQAVQARLASATSALIDGGRATTPTGLTKTAGRRR